MRQPYLTAQSKETLNPHVRQWILTILVPLGGMYSYSYDPVVNDALLESLFNFDDPEVELSKTSYTPCCVKNIAAVAASSHSYPRCCTAISRSWLN